MLINSASSLPRSIDPALPPADETCSIVELASTSQPALGDGHGAPVADPGAGGVGSAERVRPVRKEPAHLHVRICLGELTLDYVASADQARDVAQFLTTYRANQQLSVIVDDNLHSALPEMPCARLWD
ncbi:hypothetical protein ACTD5D_19870 [Nocardia takedensis]|uniref:hypothetical protein n=1 Tax=Nocardia takedensis TaxID=259390 RepID=UPI0005953AA3|nr:hypothetical protein [Nocardia takedensis]